MNYVKAAVRSAVLLLLTIAWSPETRAEVSFGVFYSNLTPHGSWLVSAEYGRVWQPSLYARGWNPYYDGHWVYTDLGWTWVSDYDWGAVPYHYGTWVVDPFLGWVWVPGFVWAPAWVVFRTGPDYIGWAPVSPGFSIDASIGSGDIDENRFIFVSAGNFLAPRIHTYVVPATQTRVMVNQTRIVNSITVENNIVVNRGLEAREIERISGKQVRTLPIERVERATPGPRFSRQEIRVGPQRANKGVRATEPVSAREPLPPERARNRKESRDRIEGPTVPDRPRANEKSEKKPAAELDTGRPPMASTREADGPKHRGSTRVGQPYNRQSAAAESGGPPEKVSGHDAGRRSAAADQVFSSAHDPQRPGAEKQRESVTKQQGQHGTPRSRQKAVQTKSERKKKDSKKPKQDG